MSRTDSRRKGFAAAAAAPNDDSNPSTARPYAIDEVRPFAEPEDEENSVSRSKKARPKLVESIQPKVEYLFENAEDTRHPFDDEDVVEEVVEAEELKGAASYEPSAISRQYSSAALSSEVDSFAPAKTEFNLDEAIEIIKKVSLERANPEKGYAIAPALKTAEALWLNYPKAPRNEDPTEYFNKKKTDVSLALAAIVTQIEGLGFADQNLATLREGGLLHNYILARITDSKITELVTKMVQFTSDISNPKLKPEERLQFLNIFPLGAEGAHLNCVDGSIHRLEEAEKPLKLRLMPYNEAQIYGASQQFIEEVVQKNLKNIYEGTQAHIPAALNNVLFRSDNIEAKYYAFYVPAQNLWQAFCKREENLNALLAANRERNVTEKIAQIQTAMIGVRDPKNDIEIRRLSQTQPKISLKIPSFF